MTAQEIVAREAVAAGVLLLSSGLAVLTLRRNLVANLLGVYLLLPGAVLLIAPRRTALDAPTFAVMLLVFATFAPIVLAMFARWRVANGNGDQSALRRAEDERA